MRITLKFFDLRDDWKQIRARNKIGPSYSPRLMKIRDGFMLFSGVWAMMVAVHYGKKDHTMPEQPPHNHMAQ